MDCSRFLLGYLKSYPPACDPFGDTGTSDDLFEDQVASILYLSIQNLVLWDRILHSSRF